MGENATGVAARQNMCVWVTAGNRYELIAAILYCAGLAAYTFRTVPVAPTAASEMAYEALRAAVAALDDPQHQVWSAASGALAKAGSGAVPALVDLLSDPDSQAHGAAAKALAESTGKSPGNGKEFWVRWLAETGG